MCFFYKYFYMELVSFPRLERKGESRLLFFFYFFIFGGLFFKIIYNLVFHNIITNFMLKNSFLSTIFSFI